MSNKTIGECSTEAKAIYDDLTNRGFTDTEISAIASWLFGGALAMGLQTKIKEVYND